MRRWIGIISVAVTTGQSGAATVDQRGDDGASIVDEHGGCRIERTFGAGHSKDAVSPSGVKSPSPVFVAKEPYVLHVEGREVAVDLAGKSRRFDFGGDAPWINSETGVSDVATVNVWNSRTARADVLPSRNIGSAGVEARVFKVDGYTAVGYVAGDGVVEKKLRSQVNSFPFPSERCFEWDLVVRFGGARFSDSWPMTTRGESPATIWQVKAPDLPPAIVMVVDTDPGDPSRLMLHFDVRPEAKSKARRIGQVGGLAPNEDIAVTVTGFLDSRTPSAGGQGFWHVRVNDVERVRYAGQTAQRETREPYSWSIGVYLYANDVPLPYSKFTYWRRARMMAR